METIELYRLTGLVHNLALDAVGNAPGFKDLSPQQVYQYVKESVQKRVKELYPTLEWSISYEQVQEAYAYITTGGDTLSRFKQDGYLSGNLYELIRAVEDRVSNIVHFSNDAVMVSALKTEMDGLERYAEAADLTEQERLTLIGYISVALHSSLYGIGAKLNPNNKWHELVNALPEPTEALRGDRLGLIYALVVVLTGGPVFGMFLGGAIAGLMTAYFYYQDQP